MNCIICKDNYQTINKICICNDCYLCDDCLVLSNHNNIKKCPNCRRDLQLTGSFNLFKYISTICLQIIIYLSISLLPFILLLFIETKNFESNELVSLLINLCICIIFIEPISIVMFTKYLNINYLRYQTFKILGITMFSIISGILINNITLLLFYIYILLPFYYTPLIVSSTFFIHSLLKSLNIYNRSKNMSYIINVQEIIC